MFESATGFVLVEGSHLRLSTRATRIGFHGCNYFGGTYRLIGHVLRVDGFDATEVGCARGLSDQDHSFATFLQSRPEVALVEPRLTLSSTEAQLTFIDRRVVRPDRPLVGTHWLGSASGLGEVGAHMSLSGVGSVKIRLTFGPSGKVSVFTGCQHGQGSFFADASTIAFADLRYDGAPCSGRRQKEASQVTMAVLQGPSASYEIHERSLFIKRADRTLLLYAEE